ncbi:MAG: NADH dehydrogenase (quinone) subunit D [Armatimonadota bacterium]|jgi:NADH-quinone oxidoreductase subunit D
MATETTTRETLNLNMGPQHPSTHGVLRLELELEGETVVKATPHIGYLHTGIEKTMEHKTYCRAIPLTDRMDYLAPLSNNLGICLAVEKLLDLEVPQRAQVARVLLTELTRIGSHLAWLATHGLELGAMTVFLYCFREREVLMDIFELCSGARMMTTYFRVGGLALDLPDGFEEAVENILDTFPGHIDDYEGLLSQNPIWLQRTKGIGVISAEDAIALGLTGPCLRASGVAHDVRAACPYSGYETYEFDVPTGENCDVYDRYAVRIQEMRQSLRIVEQALDRLPDGPWRVEDPKVTPPPKEMIHRDMESLIHHFKLYTEGFSVPPGEVYQRIESPRGELGFYVVSDGSRQPYRVHVRTPSFANLQCLPKMVEGHLVADVVAIMAGLDFVLGDSDR